MTRYVKEEELGKLYKFDELKNLGVKIGDIVAYRSTRLDEGYCWEYVLLKEDFPNNLDVALQCYKDPRTPYETFPLLGYHWCGSINFEFRLICEKEKDDFVNACVKRMYSDVSFYDNEYKCQIIHNLKKYKLLPDRKIYEINNYLEKKFGVDYLKLYEKTYGY